MRPFARFVTCVLAGVVCAAATPAARADSYEVDGGHSAVLFNVTHMNVGSFYGRFNDISGTIAHDAADAAKLRFSVTIKSESVDTNNKKRDQHLRTPDFFNAKKHPEITFKSTSAKALKDGEYEVTGDLSFLGKSKPITVVVKLIGSAEDPRGGARCGFETTFTVKRSEWGMNYMPGGLGEDVRVIVALEGVRE